MFENINININTKYPFSSFIEYGFQAFYAALFLMTWKNPEDHIALLNDLSVLILFEFVMVHSGTFMILMPKKWSILLLIPFYGAFAYYFNKATIDSSILLAYMITVINRMRFAFSDVPNKILGQEILKAFGRVGFYFVLLFTVLIGNNLVPKLGFSTVFLKSNTFLNGIPDKGIFLASPKESMCLGFLYYSIPVILFIFKTVKNRKELFLVKKARIKRS
jgi:hypothetical protein